MHQVRKSMASKIKIPAADFSFYVIVVVYPSDTGTFRSCKVAIVCRMLRCSYLCLLSLSLCAGSLSARTLQDHELILPEVESLNRVRSNTHESDESLGTLRSKPKHRVNPPVKFVFKVRFPPFMAHQAVMHWQFSSIFLTFLSFIPILTRMCAVLHWI